MFRVALIVILLSSSLFAQEVLTNPSRNDGLSQLDSIEIWNARVERFLDSLHRVRPNIRRRYCFGYRNPDLDILLMPGSTECIVRFKLEAASPTTIFVTDTKGSRKELYQAMLSAGEQNIRLSLMELTGGVYNLSVKTNTKELQGELMFARRE